MAALNAHFLDIDWFDRVELNVIGPTKLLAGGSTPKLCASSLKTGVHFAFRHDVPAATLRMVRQEIKSSLASLQESKGEDVIKNVAKCEYQIYENSARLLSVDTHHSKRIKSEATLRYVLGDPLMVLMCDSGNLKVHLEESVRSSNEEPPPKKTRTSGPPATPQRMTDRTELVSPTTPSTYVAEATSAGSRADYTCYTLRDSGDRILAVVIETKMDQSSQDALAQVLGYVAAFKKGTLFPPAAIVVTETLVDVLFFPFVKGSNRLLIAAHCSLSLWKKEVPRVKTKCLLLLACLSYAECKNFRIELSRAEDHEQIRKIVAISTENELQDERVAEMERKMKAVERERDEIERKRQAERAELERQRQAERAELERQIKELQRALRHTNTH